MSAYRFESQSESETFVFGERLGKSIEGSLLIFLNGTLGAGKTRLVQAIASGLDIEPETVNSPTFTIMTPHEGRITLVHVDAYRINDLDEAEQLGLDDWIAEGCVMAIEWSERIAKVLPRPDLIIEIEQLEEHQRAFTLQGGTNAGGALVEKIRG